MRPAWLAIMARLACLAALAPGGSARAGAWPEPVGGGQLIAKAEADAAAVGLDAAGSDIPIPKQSTERISLYADYGLTPVLSLQLVGNLESDRQGRLRSEGLGVTGLGLRYVLARGADWVLTAYAGATGPASGTLARLDPARRGAGAEVRLLAGRSLRLAGHDLFGEIQVTRLSGVAHGGQSRLDATLGVGVRPGLMVLNQLYAGREEGGAGTAAWVKSEHSLVQSFGPWRAQVGWRRTLLGRDLPVAAGPVIGLWRRF